MILHGPPQIQSKFAAYLTTIMSEKLCLKWNDHQENVNTAFGSLRESLDFTDVTLACEDGQQIEVHKIILAAFSPFFQSLLRKNKHAHPLIYMRGVKFDDLIAIVDFLYCGETNVFQENLDSFLAIAEELQLKGLMGQKYEEEKKPSPKMFGVNTEAAVASDEKVILETHKISPSPGQTERIVSIPKSQIHGDINLQELDERVKSMMTKSQNFCSNGSGRKADICKVCGKEGRGKDIRDHIEANHMRGTQRSVQLLWKNLQVKKCIRNAQKCKS